MTDRAGSEQFARAVDLRPQPALDWEKGLAATSRAYYEVATQPAILDVVSEVLDGDVILSGVSIQRRVPKAVHPLPYPATLEELVTPRHWKRRLKSILGR